MGTTIVQDNSDLIGLEFLDSYGQRLRVTATSGWSPHYVYVDEVDDVDGDTHFHSVRVASQLRKSLVRAEPTEGLPSVYGHLRDVPDSAVEPGNFYGR